jgi:putative transposase
MKSIAERKKMVEKNDSKLSLSKQCQLLSISRSSLYSKSKRSESILNIELMELIDKMHLVHPEYGSKRMYEWLTKDKNYEINQKRVSRLFYQVMRLKALTPGPHTSRGNKEHKKYPYLLKKLNIIRSNQVWMTDITYIPMRQGFMFMMAIIDVYSRAILHWSVSNTMDSQWCCKNLEECIEANGIPEIINTDQGSQFTSDDFVYRVINYGIKLSMDGKGRATDNIYIERFWRTIKYEHIYIRPSITVYELKAGVTWFINWYNKERRHSSLDNKSPLSVYNEYFEKRLVA